MATIFSKIIAGEIPSYKIAENAYCYAFLDINPLALGHTLVVPKAEVDNIFDLDAALYKELFGFAQKIGLALGQVVDCKKVGMAVIGLEVPHAHIHLVPINGIFDIDFKNPKLKLTPEEFQAIQKKIIERLG